MPGVDFNHHMSWRPWDLHLLMKGLCQEVLEVDGQVHGPGALNPVGRLE